MTPIGFIKKLFFATALCCLPSITFGGQAITRIVVFDAELVDTSLEGEILGSNPKETTRLALITDQLRNGLQSSGTFEVLDTTSAAQALTKLRDTVRYLHNCNNCELDIAKSLGAKQSVIVWVHKVSNLILNLNVVIKEVDTGRVVRTAFVDIRGNTDRSWQRGINYILKHRILEDAETAR